MFAYCNSTTTVPLADLTVKQTGYNLNTGLQSGVRRTLLNIGTAQVLGTYGPSGFYTVLTFPTISATSTSGIAERQNVSYTFEVAYKALIELGPIPSARGKENYFVNNYGVFYPKIKISPGAANAFVLLFGGGYVPFPDGPFYYCPRKDPLGNCLGSKGDQLRAKMISSGLEVPKTGWAAHHIQPVGECGSNETINGVFLAPSPHLQFTAWFASFTAVAGEDETGASCLTPLPLPL